MRKIEINHIPCYVIQPSNIKKDYTVFLYHGWGSSKETQVFLGEILANNGYTVIIPDAPYHGDRISIITNFFAKDILVEYFWKTIIKAVDEAGDLITASIDNGLAKKSKVIIAGSSMGGCIASGIAVNNSETVGLISMMGSGAWAFLEEEFRKQDGRDSLTDGELELFSKYDPVRKIEHFINKKILLLHGKNDFVLPASAQKEFYRQASKVLGEAVTYQEFDQVGHTVSLRMAEETVGWLNTYFE